ncbi:hypothetical protein DFJ73DRAFT_818172 [Zopfochytrium polystomum]|nr:hypothetical protein DFJ73DRAFT_818172 [Zopfochytrium polystomum]
MLFVVHSQPLGAITFTLHRAPETDIPIAVLARKTAALLLQEWPPTPSLVLFFFLNIYFFPTSLIGPNCLLLLFLVQFHPFISFLFFFCSLPCKEKVGWRRLIF